MIDAIAASGMARADILRAMGYAPSDRMLAHLMAGTQPLYHRGQLLVALYAERIGQPHPTTQVRRGQRRIIQRTPPPPPTQHLQSWPPIEQPKRKRLSLPKRETAEA